MGLKKQEKKATETTPEQAPSPNKEEAKDEEDSIKRCVLSPFAIQIALELVWNFIHSLVQTTQGPHNKPTKLCADNTRASPQPD